MELKAEKTSLVNVLRKGADKSPSVGVWGYGSGGGRVCNHKNSEGFQNVKLLCQSRVRDPDVCVMSSV